MRLSLAAAAAAIGGVLDADGSNAGAAHAFLRLPAVPSVPRIRRQSRRPRDLSLRNRPATNDGDTHHQPGLHDARSSARRASAVDPSLDKWRGSGSSDVVSRRMELAASVLAGLALLPASASAGGIPWTGGEKGLGSGELDLQMYLYNLINRNRPMGKTDPLDFVVARTLDENLVKALKEAAMGELQRVSGVSRRQLQSEMEELLRKRDKLFSQRYLVTDERDQYAFDLWSWLLWKVAASHIPKGDANDPLGTARRSFQLSIGRRLRDIARARHEALYAGDSEPFMRVYDAEREGLGEAVSGIERMLRVLQKDGFIRSYKVATPEYMDEDWAARSGPLNIQVSVYESASLTASTLLNDERTNFRPDWIGTAVTTYLRDCNLPYNGYEELFLDEKWRPNPADYRVSEQLYSFIVDRSLDSLKSARNTDM